MSKNYLSDIEIARNTKMVHIKEIAKELDLSDNDWDPYGKYKAKISTSVLEKLKAKKDGKLILVTAINPTKAGEGKTTVTVGLGQALNQIGKKSILALREPSLGPNFGMKGGAAGGGYSQVLPMEDINLHFTGDIHAITTAHNLLAALIDNHIHQGNELNLDTRRIEWNRVVDLNDRSLREIVIGLGGKKNGVPRETGFDITVASEIMAVLCLSENLSDLKDKISKMLIGYTYDNKPVYVRDLGAEESMTILLKEAINPNLVQTIEKTPAIIHGGPFANIAHGCNSILATKIALKLGDYVVTEAGFGADLGAEKFIHIKSLKGNLKPDAVVIVVTINTLKAHGGLNKNEWLHENVESIKKGFYNLEKHIDTINKFGLPSVVAINKYHTDNDREVEELVKMCKEKGIEVSVVDVWKDGGLGGVDLAEKVVKLSEKETKMNFLYNIEDSIENKINSIAVNVYGADGVEFTEDAKKKLELFIENGWDKLPICMAKTQYSLSDNAKLLGRPKGFKITVRDLKISLGAGFIVVLTGEIMRMPPLTKTPAALKMTIDKDGKIEGLF